MRGDRVHSDATWTQALVQVTAWSRRWWTPGLAPDTLARGERTVREAEGGCCALSPGCPDV